MIYFEKLTKIYPDETVALKDVSLSINKGEFVSIVGHSGAGKTTLLRMLLAEDRPTSGKVSVESVDVHRLHKNQIHKYRRKFGTVFQDFKLLPTKTAYENIAFAMEVAGRLDEEISRDVPDALELVGLSNKAWRFPRELSGGEKQRIAIARALVNQPEVIIADEPTGNLDPINTMEVVEILKKINQLGTTVILTTHNRGVTDSVKKRVGTRESGKIARDDKDGKYAL